MAGFILAFFAGNLILQLQPTLIGLRWPLLIAAGLLIGVGLTRQRLRTLLLLACAVLLGFSYALYHARAIQAWQLPKQLEGKDVQVTGTVISVPKYSDRGVSFIFKVDRFQHKPINTHFRLSWYGKNIVVQVGQQWHFTVRLKRPHGTLNPGAFELEKWLFQNKLRATGYVRTRSPIELIASGPTFTTLINSMRQHLQSKISQALKGQAMTGMISALTIGLRADMTPAQWQVLRNTGTSHLMAISGLHIGLIAGLFFFLGQFFWRRMPKVSIWLPAQHMGALSALISASLYSALAGFAIPTLRALIMISVFMVALLLRLNIAIGRGLLVALLLVLLCYPLAPLSPGFWLSFAAVALIAYGLSGRLRPQGVWWKWGRTQWVVTLGLAPLSLALFQQSAWLAFIANIIAIPWVGFIVVPTALLGCLSFLINAHLASGLLWLAAQALQGCWIFLSFLAELPHASLYHAISSPWILVASLMGVLLLLAPKGVPARWLGVIWLLPLLVVRPAVLAHGEVRLTLLDIGQGLASVVQTAHHVLIYDTGLRFGRFQDSGRSIIVPFLHHAGITKINRIIISHDHNDHIGGVWSLLKQYPNTPILTSNPKRLRQYRAHLCHPGQQWQWDGVKFSMLYPPKGRRYNKNDSSCVLKITTGRQSFLLTGDIERKGERYLLTNAKSALASTVLVAPHHGSKTSSSTPFVKAVNPTYVIFPVGYRNRFNFPNKIVVQRYHQQGTTMLSTAESGAISVTLMPGQTLQPPQQYRLTYRHYWVF